MSMSTGRVRHRAEAIWHTPADGNRFEVIEGELVVNPPPDLLHQAVVANLMLSVGAWVKRHGLGHVVPAPVGIVLDDANGVVPDLVYVSRERAAILRPRGIFGAPDLVVEVLSPSTEARDRGVKLQRYAAAGVPHYWLVDVRGRALEAYGPSGQGYELAGRFAAGEVFRPEPFPGLAIPVEELFV